MLMKRGVYTVERNRIVFRGNTYTYSFSLDLQPLPMYKFWMVIGWSNISLIFTNFKNNAHQGLLASLKNPVTKGGILRVKAIKLLLFQVAYTRTAPTVASTLYRFIIGARHNIVNSCAIPAVVKSIAALGLNFSLIFISTFYFNILVV